MSESTDADQGPLTGWEQDAPETDTAVRQFIQAQSAFQRLTGEVLGATVIENERFIAVDTGRPASMINFGLLLQPLDASNTDRTMTEIEALFGQPGATGMVALYSPLPTPDLSPWGWSLAGHPPLQLRSPLWPAIDTGIRIEPVRSNEDLLELERVMIEGFDFQEMRGVAAGMYFNLRLLEDHRFGAWLGYLDDEPVGASVSIVEAGIVDVLMVATLPAARRKGIGLAVTQAATRPELGSARGAHFQRRRTPGLRATWVRSHFARVVLVSRAISARFHIRQIAWVALVNLRRSYIGKTAANPQFCRCIDG